MQKNGYMDSVLATLKDGEARQFTLNENIASWRTVASRANRRIGYRRYSVVASPKLGFMAIKCNGKTE